METLDRFKAIYKYCTGNDYKMLDVVDDDYLYIKKITDESIKENIISSDKYDNKLVSLIYYNNEQNRPWNIYINGNKTLQFEEFTKYNIDLYYHKYNDYDFNNIYSYKNITYENLFNEWYNDYKYAKYITCKSISPNSNNFNKYIFTDGELKLNLCMLFDKSFRVSHNYIFNRLQTKISNDELKIYINGELIDITNDSNCYLEKTGILHYYWLSKKGASKFIICNILDFSYEDGIYIIKLKIKDYREILFYNYTTKSPYLAITNQSKECLKPFYIYNENANEIYKIVEITKNTDTTDKTQYIDDIVKNPNNIIFAYKTSNIKLPNVKTREKMFDYIINCGNLLYGYKSEHTNSIKLKNTITSSYKYRLINNGFKQGFVDSWFEKESKGNILKEDADKIELELLNTNYVHKFEYNNYKFLKSIKKKYIKKYYPVNNNIGKKSNRYLNIFMYDTKNTSYDSRIYKIQPIHKYVRGKVYNFMFK